MGLHVLYLSMLEPVIKYKRTTELVLFSPVFYHVDQAFVLIRISKNHSCMRCAQTYMYVLAASSYSVE